MSYLVSRVSARCLLSMAYQLTECKLKFSIKGLFLLFMHHTSDLEEAYVARTNHNWSFFVSTLVVHNKIVM